MNGKLKLKLTRRALFKNNRYEIFLDDIFIGSLDNRTPKLDYITSLGNHKIVIKSDYSEVEKHFDLNSEKPILPVGIKESYFWTQSNEKLSKFFKAFILGFLAVYFVIFAYLLIFDQIKFGFSLVIPFFLLLSVNQFSKSNSKFQLNFK